MQRVFGRFLSAVQLREYYSMTSPMYANDFFKNAISQRIACIFQEKQWSYTQEQIEGALEAPRSLEHGDFALPIPKLQKFGKLPANPAEIASTIAKEWAKSLSPSNAKEFVSQASPAGPFVNFSLDKHIMMTKVIGDLCEHEEKYGFTQQGASKKIVVEFSSPNIAKPFHAGNLRSTIIGNFLVKLHRALGFQVSSLNYLGDWGKQYGLLAVGFERFGSEEELLADPILHLFNVYVKINKVASDDPTIHDLARAYFKRMEDGDKESLALWERFRALSIEKYKKIYYRLNVEFDEYSGESQYSEGMYKVIEELKSKNILNEDNDAQVVDLTAKSLGKAIVVKKDGTTLYLTRDIAAAIDREKRFNFDDMYYVVAAQQDLHFKQLFAILENMGNQWHSRCHHINFGMVKGMSTRKGEVVFLEDILNEAQLRMHTLMRSNPDKYAQIENPEEVADLVGLSAVVVSDFGARRIRDYEFQWDSVLQIDGDTGPYLQFAHARLSSVERKGGVVLNKNANLSLLTEKEAFLLMERISKFPEAIQNAFHVLEPSTMVTYLMTLCHAISQAFETMWVKGAEKEVGEARLLLYWSARVTLGNGLRILGLRPLERM